MHLKDWLVVDNIVMKQSKCRSCGLLLYRYQMGWLMLRGNRQPVQGQGQAQPNQGNNPPQQAPGDQQQENVQVAQLLK